ncbi:MAG: hypothetical protein ABFS12_09690 [Bacteroidota bacterium]
MLNKIKVNLAESIALKKFTKTQNFGNNFKHFISDAKDILVILPEKFDDINKALKVIEFLNSEKKNLYLFYNIDVANYLPTGLNFISVNYKENDITKIGLPSKDLLSKIEIIFFDFIIDLNIEDCIFSSVIANAPRSNYRIGFSKENADKFYNFQVPVEINSEKSYRNLLNSLRMF